MKLRLCQYISCPFRWRFSPINFLQISGAARIALFSGLFRRTGAGLLNAQPTSFRCATNLNDETDKLFFDKALASPGAFGPVHVQQEVQSLKDECVGDQMAAVQNKRKILWPAVD